MKNDKASLTSIARACDVSAMTVSRALRSGAPAKESTRHRILQVAEKMGYHPGGRMGRPRQIEKNVRPMVVVVMGNMGKTMSLFHSELLSSIEHELFRRGHNCVIRTCPGDYPHFLSVCESLPQSPAVGTLIAGYFPLEQLGALLQRSVSRPVLVDNPGDSELDSPYDSVSFDNVEAARIAMRHLLSIGRKRIVLVKGFSGHYFSDEIEQGYLKALTQSEISIDKALILETDFSAEKAQGLIAETLDKGIAFDGVFTNDEMACGVLRALHERKIEIPSKVAVVGCDGLPVGLHTMPKLTTVILDYQELGRAAVELLFNMTRKERSPRRIRLAPVLEARESA